MEIELDSGEIIYKQTEEIIGESLLLQNYSFNNVGNETTKGNNKGNNKNVRESVNLSERPVTPLNARQSQILASSTNKLANNSKMPITSQSQHVKYSLKNGRKHLLF